MKKIIYESDNVWSEEDKTLVYNWCDKMGLESRHNDIQFNDDKTFSIFTNSSLEVEYYYIVPPFPIENLEGVNLVINNEKLFKYLPVTVDYLSFNKISLNDLPKININYSLYINDCNINNLKTLPIGNYDEIYMENSSINNINISKDDVNKFIINLFNTDNYHYTITNDIKTMVKMCSLCDYNYILNNIYDDEYKLLFDTYTNKVNLSQLEQSNIDIDNTYFHIFTHNNPINSKLYNKLNNKSIIDIFLELLIINSTNTNYNFNYFYNISKYIDYVQTDNSSFYKLFQWYNSEINLNNNEISILCKKSILEIKEKYEYLYEKFKIIIDDIILNKLVIL